MLAFPDAPLQIREVPTDQPRRNALEAVDQLRELHGRRVLDQQVYVVVLAIARHEHGPEVGADLPECSGQVVDVFGLEHAPAILGHEHQVDVKCGYAGSATPIVLVIVHNEELRPSCRPNQSGDIIARMKGVLIDNSVEYRVARSMAGLIGTTRKKMEKHLDKAGVAHPTMPGFWRVDRCVQLHNGTAQDRSERRKQAETAHKKADVERYNIVDACCLCCGGKIPAIDVMESGLLCDNCNNGADGDCPSCSQPDEYDDLYY